MFLCIRRMLMNAACDTLLEYFVLFAGDAENYEFMDVGMPMPELPPEHAGKDIPDKVLQALGWLRRVHDNHSATMEFLGKATDMSYADMMEGLYGASDLGLAWMQGLSINNSLDEGALVFRLANRTLAHLPRGIRHQVSDKSKNSYKYAGRSR
jgi:hypothetical protein